MSRTAQSGYGDLSEPTAGTVRDHLNKILASRHFRRADRLSRFLRFIVEQTLDGTAERLKEAVLGLEVFDRPASEYDPRIDPIVRVQAGRLRARLEAYYAGDGGADEIRIDIPKGNYAAVFRLRHEKAEEKRPLPMGKGSRTIAVLPFVNLSAEGSDEFFSDGLTEDLIHTLAQMSGLRVIARTSSFQFKGAARDIRRIGQQLGAELLLEGAIQRADDRLRVTAQLVSVADGCTVWSQRYDRTVRDVFSIQDEIGESIAGALRPTLGDSIRLRVSGQTGDLEAYIHYLRGRFCWNQRSEEGLRSGVRHFEEAIRHDGRYARAYSGLADCHVLLAMSGLAPANENMAPAKKAALQALELDPGLAEAHTSLAGIYTYEWEREKARNEYDRALDLDPNYASLHHWLGCFYLAGGGHFDAALEHTERARELDPLSLPIIADLALLHWFRDELDAGIARCRETLEIDPHFHRPHWYFGLLFEQRGEFDKAEAAYREALRLCGRGAFYSRIEASLAHCFAVMGRRKESRHLLDRLQHRARTGYVSHFDLANVFAGLGEDEVALRHLHNAVEDHESFLIFLRGWPPFRKFHARPEFQQMLADMRVA